MSTSPPPTPARERAGARWTVEQRGAAFRAYFSTGSRRQARKQTGVPERTISTWLTDERYADERRAVHEGLITAVKDGAAARGADLVAATNEAVLVCRQALRKDPDGKTASSLLGALSRARETEDRIGRLDAGSATEIAGITLLPEDREAFEKWYAEYRAEKAMTPEERIAHVNASLDAIVAELRQDPCEPYRRAS